MTVQHELSEAEMIEHVKNVFEGLPNPWVLFAHGTVVVRHDTDNVKESAIEALSEFGPVHPGSPAGDFSVIRSAEPGWLVTSHHEDIVTFVSDKEMGGDEATDMAVGLFGRGKRGQDADDQRVIHVQV